MIINAKDMLKKLFLFVVFLSLVVRGYSQYSGTYVLGNENSDFSSFNEAINSIESLGTSDTVFIDVQEGVYSEYFDFLSANYSHPVIFRNPGPATSSVILKSINGSVRFSFCRNIHFYNMLFELEGNFGVRVTHSSNFSFESCTIEGEFDFAYTENVLANKNIIKKRMSVSFGNNINIFNNHFHYNVTIGHLEESHLCHYSFNNHGLNSKFRAVYYENNLYTNNNFSHPILFSFGSPEYIDNAFNNNYFPAYGTHGNNIYHFDPHYQSANSLNASNSLLIGKGFYHPFVPDDQTGIIRSQFPTIGANELCISDDNIEIRCGEELQLKTCSSSLQNGIWMSEGLVIDSLNSSPIVSPTSSTMYYFLDLISVPIDSIYIEVNPFTLDLPGIDSTRCGFFGRLLFSEYTENSVEYIWIPEDSILHYGNYSWYANPMSTTTYTLIANHPECGSYIDSTIIDVDPKPFANASIEEEGVVVKFTNKSFCADSLLWNFGDGNTSVDSNPIHTYDTSGVIPFTLIAYNSYTTDTLNSFVVVVQPNGFKDQISNNVGVLFPNPVNGIFYIDNIVDYKRIEIFDYSGNRIRHILTKASNQVKIELINPISGIYLCQIHFENGIIVKKFTVVNM